MGLIQGEDIKRREDIKVKRLLPAKSIYAKG